VACRKCYIYHYLLPRLEKELWKLKIRVGPIIPPGPGPDPPPFFNAVSVERDLIRTFAGDPDPEPNVFSREVRLRASLSFRKSLADTLSLLDKEIETLQGA
jgi:hypothetical protein